MECKSRGSCKIKKNGKSLGKQRCRCKEWVVLKFCAFQTTWGVQIRSVNDKIKEWKEK